MDPHAVNAMGMQGGMSMPMSMSMAGANGANPQGMAMNGMAMNAYGVPQQQQPQQQMMMNMNQMNMGSMPMKMNPNAMNQAAVSASGPGMQVPGAQAAAGADWRIQLTREHRANLIAKIYNEMVRVSADPVPGIKLWMNVSWYELTLYKESRTQEEYISKIFTRLKSLRAQQTDMNAVMAAQTLPNQGMLSRLDFSYYNTLNLNQRAGAPGANGAQVGGYPGHPQFGGPASSVGATQPQPGKPVAMSAGGVPTNPAAPNGANITPRTSKPEGGVPGDMTAEYWQQHAALKSKYHDDVEKVHSAFKKYVDHMKGHDETEQKKKLRYLLSYVQLCASILNEDKTTHAPRKIEELDKVYKYIVKIVNPYLKKLRTETDKRSFTPNASTGSGPNPAMMNPSMTGSPSATPATAGLAAAPANTSGVPSAMHMQPQQQSQPNQQNMSLQQKQQQYLMQQRAQHMQNQQQRMQVQARQQQMMQQQHMMKQQQQQKSQSIQANMANAQQNSQNSGAQQTPQQKQQQLQRPQQSQSGQQQPAQSQPGTSQQPQQNRQHPQQQSQSQQPQSQPQQSQPQPQQSQQSQSQQPKVSQHQQSAGNSRGETSALNLDDSLYGGMDSSGLMQMPSNLASSGSSSGFMSFTNDLSPTNFSGMDLLDMDGFMGQDGNSSSGQGSSGQNTNNSSGGNNTNAGDGADSDLMFMESL